MKIRLEIPKARLLPSQGRNADSNSAGSATAFGFAKLSECFYGDAVPTPEQGQSYRAWLDPDKTDAEFVFFVGWTRSNDQMVFEDGNGDLHAFVPDEVEVV